MNSPNAATNPQIVLANAIKASGVLVQLSPEEFLSFLERLESPLVVMSPKSFLSSQQYLTSHKGLAFYTRSKGPLDLPKDAEIVLARRIWIPR